MSGNGYCSSGTEQFMGRDGVTCPFQSAFLRGNDRRWVEASRASDFEANDDTPFITVDMFRCVDFLLTVSGDDSDEITAGTTDRRFLDNLRSRINSIRLRKTGFSALNDAHINFLYLIVSITNGNRIQHRLCWFVVEVRATSRTEERTASHRQEGPSLHIVSSYSLVNTFLIINLCSRTRSTRLLQPGTDQFHGGDSQ